MLKTDKRVVLLVAALLGWSCSSTQNPILISSDGGWNWCTQPIAVHHKGAFDRTYIGWVTGHGDVQVGSYDHKTNQIEQSTLHATLNVDDHANPALLILEDGRIMAFYSAHNGDTLYFRVSTKSEDIRNWEPEKTIPVNSVGKGAGYTYPKPCRLKNENNAIYLFWRGGNYLPTFSVSSDTGQTWSEAKTLFEVPGERPYLLIHCDGDKRIGFTLSDGHPNEVKNNNVYYFRYQAGTFYRSNNFQMGGIGSLPFTPSDVDLVYNSSTTGSNSWIWDITTDEKGDPSILFTTFPTVNDHRYNIGYLNNGNWEHSEITSGGTHLDGEKELYYSGGIAFAPRNPGTVYLSRQIGLYHEIERWNSKDGGRKWSGEAITRNSFQTNARPVVVGSTLENNLGVIWWSGVYTYYTDFQTQVLALFFKK